MKHRNLFVTASVGIVVAAAIPLAHSQWLTMDTIQAVGITTDGFSVACRGIDCANFLLSAGGQVPRTMLPGMGEGGGGGQLNVSKKQVCDFIKSKQPNNCFVFAPPSTPTYDPSWQPNGCGAGGMENYFGPAILLGLYGQYAGGGMDAPFNYDGRTVSFLSSCNTHDRCWGEGMERTACDATFLENMQYQCTALTRPEEQGACMGMASLYHAGVSSTVGTGNYEAALAQLTCAAWVKDVTVNRC